MFLKKTTILLIFSKQTRKLCVIFFLKGVFISSQNLRDRATWNSKQRARRRECLDCKRFHESVRSLCTGIHYIQRPSWQAFGGTQNVIMTKPLLRGYGIGSNFLLSFTLQNWMAYEYYPSVWEAKESAVVKFSANEIPSEQDSYALCKVWQSKGFIFNVITTGVLAHLNSAALSFATN